MIVDAHLDLAYNALRGRNVTRPAAEQAPDEEGIPTVGLPDLSRGGVGLICATVFVQPAHDDKPGYRTPHEAHAEAWKQISWYREQEAAGTMRFVRSAAQLPCRRDEDGATRIESRAAGHSRSSILQSQSSLSSLLLLEGADAIRTPGDLPALHEAGLRIVGLTWVSGRYAGGNRAPGPITPEGLELVQALDRFRIIHDVSHLSEQSFWQLVDSTEGPIIASHSNCRAIVPGERQLTDDMIRAIAARGGVIGINFYDRFLLPPEEHDKRKATLADVVRHIKHIADLLGTAEHIGLGTDMDGGLGREQIPVEIASSADLPRVAQALKVAGFSSDDVSGILAGNWLRFFGRAL